MMESIYKQIDSLYLIGIASMRNLKSLSFFFEEVKTRINDIEKKEEISQGLVSELSNEIKDKIFGFKDTIKDDLFLMSTLEEIVKNVN